MKKAGQVAGSVAMKGDQNILYKCRNCNRTDKRAYNAASEEQCNHLVETNNQLRKKLDVWRRYYNAWTGCDEDWEEEDWEEEDCEEEDEEMKEYWEKVRRKDEFMHECRRKWKEQGKTEEECKRMWPQALADWRAEKPVQRMVTRIAADFDAMQL